MCFSCCLYLLFLNAKINILGGRMVVLTLNCGSSSVKYQVYQWNTKEVMARGIVERVGLEGSFLEHHSFHGESFSTDKAISNPQAAVQLILETITDKKVGVIKTMNEVTAVGHRVLHGGQQFAQSVIITPLVLKTFRELAALGPLHMPANIGGIEAAQKVLPEVTHCAIMDTAWHQTMPASSYVYALPYSWYAEHGVRRYGFHGTSFLYTAKRASVLLAKAPQETNLIIAHIGNGASISAVKEGCAYDTSMGLTPLEGLVMGTRCGDIDPAIISYMMRCTQLTPFQVEEHLNKKSGILGITQKSPDRRDMNTAADAGDSQALLARQIECYRLKKYIGAYIAALGQIDALVFTAGVGEMSWQIRQESLQGLEHLGIILNREKNKLSCTRNAETLISADHSPVKIFVIPTDEELVMTEDTYALTQGIYNIHTQFTYSFQNPEYVNKERMKALEKELAKNPELKRVIVGHR